jgi:hypothetical protein
MPREISAMTGTGMQTSAPKNHSRNRASGSGFHSSD